MNFFTNVIFKQNKNIVEKFILLFNLVQYKSNKLRTSIWSSILKVLYTHQKTKKKKIWQDGVLTVPVGGSRAFLCDETNRQISAVYLNKKVFFFIYAMNFIIFFSNNIP